MRKILLSALAILSLVGCGTANEKQNQNASIMTLPPSFGCRILWNDDDGISYSASVTGKSINNGRGVDPASLRATLYMNGTKMFANKKTDTQTSYYDPATKMFMNWSFGTYGAASDMSVGIENRNFNPSRNALSPSNAPCIPFQ